MFFSLHLFFNQRILNLLNHQLAPLLLFMSYTSQTLWHLCIERRSTRIKDSMMVAMAFVAARGATSGGSSYQLTNLQIWKSKKLVCNQRPSKINFTNSRYFKFRIEFWQEFKLISSTKIYHQDYNHIYSTRNLTNNIYRLSQTQTLLKTFHKFEPTQIILFSKQTLNVN